MKSVWLYIFLPSFIYRADSSPCLNNSTYTHLGTKETCNWIRWSEVRRQDLCQLSGVRSNCPQSCGLCCENDPSFQFSDSFSVKRNCSWIETSNKFQYCEKRRNATAVKFRCPLACSICHEEVRLIMGPPPPSLPVIPQKGEISTKDSNSDHKNTGIIVGSVVSALSVLGLGALYRRCRSRDDFTITTKSRMKDNDEETATAYEIDSSVESKEDFVARGIPPDGVSIFWIKNTFIEEAQKNGLKSNDTSLCQLEDPSSVDKGVLRSIGEHSVCPRDGEVGAAIIDSIDKEEYTGSANLILNCSEDVSIADVISTLSDFCFFNNYEVKEVYVWASFLCINYHRLSLKKNITGRDYKSSLRKRISSIGRVLTIVSPWVDEPRKLISISGLYELYTAIDIGCKIFITTTIRDKNKLIIESLPKENDLINLFKTIDRIQIQDAISLNAADEMILRLVRYGPGFDRVNRTIRARLRRWAKKQVLKALKYHEGRSHDAMKDEDFAFLCSQVGYALIRADEGADALSLYNKALQINKNVRGDAHTDVASLYMNTGMVLEATGDLKGAIKEYQKVVDVHQLVYGEEHIETANTYNQIGMVMEADNNLFGAVENYQKSLLIREKVYGSDNPYTGKK